MLPDQESINIEIAALAEQARDELTPAAPTSAPIPRPSGGGSPGVIAPIYMGKSHEVIPDRYVLHYSITSCTNRRAESRDNEFYALSYLRSRVNGTRVRHLTRCDRPLFNLPVDRIPTGIHRVPYCCECEVIDLSHLPPPPSASQLYDLPETTLRGRTAAKSAKPAAKPPAKPVTLDDLI